MTSISSSTQVQINSRISVKFPFEPYECQKIFMKNVVDVLDRKLDAALESPTGTGKTLSLLCSTLAWVQREKETKPLDFATWQAGGAGCIASEKTTETMRNSFIPTIFYASRTHSQLEQVVHELNRTEYKWVKTTILGSREHFCINQKVKKIKESNRQAHVCRGLVSKRSCHYYNKFDACTSDKISEFMEKGKAMDIEDFVKAGTQNSLCPYFLSRQRSETAELILLPYNYIIDPKMRRRYKLDLKNSIVIFDEAHNLESICESNASAELTSTAIALCIEELKKVLALIVDEEETARAEADLETDAFGSQKIDLTKKIIENLRTEDLMTVLEKVFLLEEEMDKLFISDKLKSIPPLDGKASDGEILLETLEKSGFDGNSVERIVDILRDAISYLLSKNEEVSLAEKGDGMEKLANFLLSIYSTHAQEVAAAVGDESVKLVDRVDPKTVARNCKLYIRKEKESGKLAIKYFCFQASISMRMLKMRGVRNVLLASGTLSPIQAFTYNMGLNFGAILENDHALKQVPVLTSIVTRGRHGGLMGSFHNRKNVDYVSDVAEALIRVMEATPQGILVFFSSYSQMEDLVGSWKATKRAGNSIETLWENMEKIKKVVVEPRVKEELAAVRMKYSQGVSEPNGAALLAVCRGKVSEGIDFCDAESRAVIIVGIPYPPVHDERVVLKKMYLDGLVGRKDKTECLSSGDWYQMEAFRAVNQAIGRVLRHKNDFGTVVLLDTRYASAKLEMFPKWLRSTVCKSDTDGCVLKTVRFFKERGHLIETSKSDYVKKQVKLCKSFRQAKKTMTSSESQGDITEITLEDMFSPANIKLEKKESSIGLKLPPPPSSSSSMFSLPTNEDELQFKKWEQQNDIQSVSMPPSATEGNKRKLKIDVPGPSSSPKEPPKKKKIVLLTRNTLPEKHQKALDIPTADILKDMSEGNKKQFAATLRGYKEKIIQWEEVFQRFQLIFVPQRPDLFISCSNILRSEDKMKYLKKAMEMKIY